MKHRLSIFLGIALLLYLPSQAKSSHQLSTGTNSYIRVDFNQSKNETAVSINPFLTVNAGYNMDIGMMAVSGRFTYSGQKVTVPKEVELRFLSITSMGWQFANEKNLDLTIIVDGETLSPGRATRVHAEKQLQDSRFYDKRDPNYRESYVSAEVVSAFISFENFARIANGKKVEIKLGNKKLKLEKKHLEAYQQLHSKMTS